MRRLSKTIKKKKIKRNIKNQLLKSVRENDEVEEIEINIANVTDPGEELRMINCYGQLINNQHKRVIIYVARQGEIHKKFKTKKTFSKMQKKVDQQCILK